MAVDQFAVLDFLRDGDQEVQALATRLGDQVSYNDVASALASLSTEGLVEPSGGNRWKITAKGRARFAS
jgi:predicted transcriptional regulator